MTREVEATFRPFNPNRLHEELRAALGARALGVSSGPGGLVIHLVDEATDDDERQARAVLDAHDPQALTAAQQAMHDFLTRWRGGALAGKPPAQIYQHMQGRIDGWASLAAAKADLREWLPLIGAALWYVLSSELDE